MRRAYAVPDVRSAEAATGPLLADGTLMARAAAALAALATDLLPRVYGARVVVVVGSGDNGGDALHAGALLARRGATVDALLLAAAAHAGGSAALLRAGGRTVAAADPRARDVLARADLLLDGITGIGGHGGLRAPAADLLGLVPEQAVVVAVDLPSGVEAATGEVTGAAVAADVTLCFGALKPGVLVDPGAEHAGVVLAVDIGIAPYLPAAPALESLEAADVAALLRRPRPTDDKYSRGVVGVAAGSDRYTGAGVLAVAGALGAGAGMVRAALTPAVADLVRARFPETVLTVRDPADPLGGVGRVQAWVVGPGGGTDDDAARVLHDVLGEDVPVVVDADGLTLLAERPDLVARLRARSAPTVLTPHAGELARLLDLDRADVEARRLHHVVAAAQRWGCTVLLKGSTTVVAHDARPVRANPRATAWLASAGAGDVLSGVLGALLAQGLEAIDAASAAAWLHARAGAAASGGGPLRASEVAAHVPGVVAALLDPDAAADSPS